MPIRDTPPGEAVDPLEYIRRQQQAAALANLVRPTPTVPLSTVYGPVAAAYKRGGPQDFVVGDLDIMNPDWVAAQEAVRDTPPGAMELGLDIMREIRDQREQQSQYLTEYQQNAVISGTPGLAFPATSPNLPQRGREIDLWTALKTPPGRRPDAISIAANLAEDILTKPGQSGKTAAEEFLNLLEGIAPGAGAVTGAILSTTKRTGRAAAALGQFVKSEEGAQFGPAVAKAGVGNLGEAIAKGIANKRVRMENIVGRIQKGEKINAKQAEELRDFLKDIDPARASEYDRILTPVVLSQRTEDAARANAQINTRFATKVTKAQDKKLAQELRAVEREIAEAEQRIGKDQANLLQAEQKTAAVRSDLAARQAVTEARIAERGAQRVGSIEERLAGQQVAATAPRVTPQGAPRMVLSISRADADRLVQEGRLLEFPEDLRGRLPPSLITKVDAEEAKFLAQTFRQNPSLLADRKAVSRSDLVYDSARYMGMTPEQMEAEIARRGLQEGEASAFLLAVNATVVRLGQETRELAAKVVDGKVTQAMVDDAYARYISFVGKVGGADSEAGRMLNALKTARPQALVGAMRQNLRISANRSHVADLNKQLGTQRAVLAQLQKEAQTAKAAAQQLTDARLKKAAAEHAEKVEAQARAAATRVGKIQSQIDNAEAEMVKAIARRAELGEEVRLRAIKRALKQGTDPEAIKALALLRSDEVGKIAETMRSLHKLSTGEKVVAFMSNNLYSSIASQEANAIGGAIRVAEKMLMRSIAERTTAPLLARVSGEALSIERGEAVDMAAAVVHSAPGAAHAFIDTLLHGLDETGARLADIRKGRPFPGKKGLFLEWALRMNGSFDAGARHLANHMEGFALARRTATRELKAGITATDEMAERMAHLRNNPTDEMLTEQANRAMEVSYGGRLGGFGEKVQGLIGHMFEIPGLGPTPALRLLFAASRFTWAATAFSVELSGGGLARMIKLASKGPQFHAEAAVAGARGGVGALMMAGGFGLYSQGLLMGKDPEGRGRDDSVLVNGQWVPLKWAWPLTGGLIYAARIGDAEKEGRLAENANLLNYVQFGASGMTDAITSYPVVRVTAGLYDAIRKGGETGERFLANLLSSRVIPNASALRDINRMVNNIEVDPKGFWDYLKQNTPLAYESFEWSQAIAPRIDPYTGMPVERAVQGWERLNPAADPERRAVSLVEQEYVRHNQEDRSFSPLTLPSDKFKAVGINIALDRREHTRYSELVGQARDEVLGAIIGTAEYQDATPAKQREMLNRGEGQAVASGRKALGLELATTAADSKKIAQGTIIAMGSGTAYDRAKSLDVVAQSGKLTPDVIAQVDRSRGPISPATDPRVIDGDTLELTLDGKRTAVRLVGINTAETDKGGALDQFLVGKDIEVMSIKQDRYGRTVAEIYANGESASDYLERQGRAVRTYYEQDSADLRVTDLMEGKRLRDSYDAAPPWRPGRMAQMQQRGITPKAVEQAAYEYKELIKRAEDKGVKSPWQTDPQLKTFYASQAGGMLRELYSVSGTAKDAEVSAERNSIEKHPLWAKFRS